MLTVYTKNNCGYCMQAKALLKNRNIEFEEINIEENPEAREFLINEGLRTMPQIFEGKLLWVVGGFHGLKDKLDKEKIDTTQLGTL